MTATTPAAQHTGTSRKAPSRFVPALCNVLGTLLIVGVFALTLPLALPQLIGYQVFDVVSGSMEPAIPTGSAIYVRAANPADVQADEVIAFHDGGSVVAHRVVTNRTSLGEFVTKGDANNTEDLRPVAYDDLIGVVALSVPVVGEAMALYSSAVGKVYLALTLACGIMLNVLADQLRRRAAGRRAASGTPGTPATLGAPAAPASVPRRGTWAIYALMIVLALVFVGSAGVVAFVRHQYTLSSRTYASAASAYTTAGDGSEASTVALGARKVVAPKRVDFAALTLANPDVVGWIYCPGTVIDYPVLLGTTNDTYLRHDYTGEYNINGSIFVDSGNRGTFEDANTIVYGHHMSSGDMFACLDQWADQQFYEKHPVMWLLTPTQDYQVVLVSGHHVNAYSDMYQILPNHDEAFARFLASAQEMSDFVPVEGADVNPERNYVMLTTCAYIFDNARYVLHGKLVPVDSAGGVAL